MTNRNASITLLIIAIIFIGFQPTQAIAVPYFTAVLDWDEFDVDDENVEVWVVCYDEFDFITDLVPMNLSWNVAQRSGYLLNTLNPDASAVKWGVFVVSENYTWDIGNFEMDEDPLNGGANDLDAEFVCTGD